MTTYTLNIYVDAVQLKFLKDNGYSLCLAKQCNSLYTVVWKSSVNFCQENKVKWSDKYQVFGAMEFKVGARIRATTNVENIDFGQTCTLDKEGIMEPATGVPDHSGTFAVKNEYDPICLGVNCLIGGFFETIFVSPESVDPGIAKFTPVNKVKVWFEQEIGTGTMILDVTSKSIEVDFTGRTEAKIGYVGKTPAEGRWEEMK